MNLDDLLKSIREEDDDSKGAKIDPEKFLTNKNFSKPFKGATISSTWITQCSCCFKTNCC